MDLMSLLVSLLMGIAFVVLLRFLPYFLKMLNQNKKTFKLLNSLFPYFEFAAWIFFVFWFVNRHFAHSPIHLILVSSLSLVLIISLAWFYLRNLVPGIIFKSSYLPKIGKNVRIGNKQGSIKHIGYLSLELQSAEGESIKIPYSRLMEKDTVEESARTDLKMQRISLAIPSNEKAQQIHETLKRKMLEMPWVVASQDVKVMVKQEENCFKVDIQFLSLDEDMLSSTEEILRNYIGELCS